jgi:hypothetical protein
MINGNGVSMAEINLNEEQLKNMDTERLQVMVGNQLGDGALAFYECLWHQAKVADYLGCSEATLLNWRKDGYGPEFYKFGGCVASGPVRYDRFEVEQWRRDMEGRPVFKNLKAAQRYIDKLWIQSRGGHTNGQANV